VEEHTAILRLKQGDPAGLEFLVHTYQLRAIRAAYLITRDPEQARDIVQAAFLRAFERIDQFDVSQSFGPWFLRSVINDALKAVSRNRQVSLDVDFNEEEFFDFVSETASDPEQVTESTELREAVLAALDLLTPEQRAIIVLHYYFGWTDAEIARRFARPRGTVRRWLHDARGRLRELLRPWSPFSARLGE
jgi:RNA polymerase sigma-70 factor (ECF subfamily)